MPSGQNKGNFIISAFWKIKHELMFEVTMMIKYN